MTSANLNIVTINPRMLSRSEAARYCGIPIKKFPAICDVEPIRLAIKIIRYDKNVIDEWLDTLSQCDGQTSDEELVEGLK